MSWVATAIAGSAVLGALSSNSAAKKQAGAARDAAGMTMDQYLKTRDDLMPWQTTGKLANTRLAELLGLATPESRMPDLVKPTREQFTRQPTSMGRVLQKTQYATQDLRGNWVMQNGSLVQQTPTPDMGGFDQAGYDRAMADYNSQLNVAQRNPSGYGSLLDNFTGQDLTSEPGYQFGLEQGERGINNMAMAGSGRNSGATMKALLRYNQDYAGTKFNDAFNRDSTNKSRTYGFLTGQSGMGANAAAQTGGLGANAAGQAGNFMTQGADASAAGTVGMANAVSGGVGNYLAYQQNQNMADYLKGLRGSSVSGTPFGYKY